MRREWLFLPLEPIFTALQVPWRPAVATGIRRRISSRLPRAELLLFPSKSDRSPSAKTCLFFHVLSSHAQPTRSCQVRHSLEVSLRSKRKKNNMRQIHAMNSMSVRWVFLSLLFLSQFPSPSKVPILLGGCKMVHIAPRAKAIGTCLARGRLKLQLSFLGCWNPPKNQPNTEPSSLGQAGYSSRTNPIAHTTTVSMYLFSYQP
ncbi:hypothetical protein F5X99DRAFT_313938 [Biscogniauxia marginata]|nr:hypothetical protein F5X99DRAFT_313938 [Biscogniauxia marginata]